MAFKKRTIGKEKFKYGFTLIELLVVIATIVILTGFVLTSYPGINKNFSLHRSASRLAQDIRGMEERAVSMREIGGTPPDGYGILFDKNASPYSYQISAFEESGGSWSATDSWQETVSFESGIRISALVDNGVSTSTLILVFEPPNPTVWTNDASSSSSTITLYIETDATKVKSVSLNQTGLVTTE